MIRVSRMAAALALGIAGRGAGSAAACPSAGAAGLRQRAPDAERAKTQPHSRATPTKHKIRRKNRCAKTQPLPSPPGGPRLRVRGGEGARAGEKGPYEPNFG